MKQITPSQTGPRTASVRVFFIFGSILSTFGFRPHACSKFIIFILIINK